MKDVTMETTEPLDGGWGWVVTIATMVIQAMFGCVIRGFGVLYLRLLDRFGGSASATTWVGTCLLITWGLTGPVSGWLMKRFSCRTVALGGSILLSCSILATGVAPSLLVAYITFSAAGSGLSLAFNSCFLIINQYFRARKALAMGLTTIGAALGMFVCPPLLELFFETYGFTGGMVMFSGLTLQGCVAAALFYPIKPYKVTSKPYPTIPASAHMEVVTTEKGSYSKIHQSDIVVVENNCKTLTNGGVHYEGNIKQTNLGILSAIVKYSKLFKDPYLSCLMFVSYGIFYIIYTTAAFAPALAVQRGISVRLATSLVTANGGCDAAGKIVTAVLFDIPGIKKYRAYIYAFYGFSSSLAVFALPLCTSYLSILVACCVFGLLNGGFGGQRNTILTDLVRPDKIPDALGLALFFASFGCTSGSLITGLIKDVLGRYDAAFLVSGTISLLCSSLLFLLLVFRKPETAPPPSR